MVYIKRIKTILKELANPNLFRKYELAKMHILFPSLMIENEEKVKKMSSSEIKSIVDSAIKDLSHK